LDTASPVTSASDKATTEKKSEGDYGNWSLYAPSEGEFEVRFPKKPELKMMDLNGQPVHVAGIRQNKVEDLSFTCHWFVNEKPEEYDAAETIYLMGFQVGAVNASKGRLIEGREIFLDGFRGRDFTIAIADTRVARNRVYVAGRRVIDLGVMGPSQEAISTGDALKFLDSLKINSEKH
jgi:hypothetical protein